MTTWAKFELHRWKASDTYSTLTPEERRIAQVLYTHQSACGPLPDRDIAIADAAHEDDTSNVTALRAVLVKAKFELRDGRWFHPVSMTHFDAATAISRGASAAARARWGIGQVVAAQEVDATALRPHMRTHMQSKSKSKSLENGLTYTSASPPPVLPLDISTARDVLGYWSEKAHTKPRSAKVEAAIIKRIDARVKDGFSPADLKRAVDVACADEFYVAKGYYKQPDVIFRNAERVQSLLARVEHARAKPVPL